MFACWSLSSFVVVPPLILRGCFRPPYINAKFIYGSRHHSRNGNYEAGDGETDGKYNGIVPRSSVKSLGFEVFRLLALDKKGDPRTGLPLYRKIFFDATLQTPFFDVKVAKVANSTT